jgi:hypothetical protein
MGRPKKELKKIHRKKVKKAKEKIKAQKAGEITFDSLTAKAKHLLEKGKKKKTILN